MRPAILLLLVSGCAAKGWRPVTTCEPWPGVRVASESVRCEAIAGAFDMAASLAESEGAATRRELEYVARKVSFVVIDVPRLYTNQRGREVAGLLACDELPRVLLDRTLQGLGHELLHARDCIYGRPLTEPKSGWKSFWTLGAWR